MTHTPLDGIRRRMEELAAAGDEVVMADLGCRPVPALPSQSLHELHRPDGPGVRLRGRIDRLAECRPGGPVTSWRNLTSGLRERLALNPFLLGRTLEEAVENAFDQERLGYRHLFDPLLPEALSDQDADRAGQVLLDAVGLIAEERDGRSLVSAPGLLVDLAALTPRLGSGGTGVSRPDLRSIARAARTAGIPVTFALKGPQRLDVLLDTLERLVREPGLFGWSGLGLIVEAGDRRAAAIINWAATLSRMAGTRLTLRLDDTAGESPHPLRLSSDRRPEAALAAFRLALGESKSLNPCLATTDPTLVSAAVGLAGTGPHWELMSPLGIAEILGRGLVRPLGDGISWRILAPAGTGAEARSRLRARILGLAAPQTPLGRLLPTPTPGSGKRDAGTTPAPTFCPIRSRVRPATGIEADRALMLAVMSGLTPPGERESEATALALEAIAGELIGHAAAETGATVREAEADLRALRQALRNGKSRGDTGAGAGKTCLAILHPLAPLASLADPLAETLGTGGSIIAVCPPEASLVARAAIEAVRGALAGRDRVQILVAGQGSVLDRLLDDARVGRVDAWMPPERARGLSLRLASRRGPPADQRLRILGPEIILPGEDLRASVVEAAELAWSSHRGARLRAHVLALAARDLDRAVEMLAGMPDGWRWGDLTCLDADLGSIPDEDTREALRLLRARSRAAGLLVAESRLGRASRPWIAPFAIRLALPAEAAALPPGPVLALAVGEERESAAMAAMSACAGARLIRV